MEIVAHDEQRKALEAAKELKLRIEFEMKKLEDQLEEWVERQTTTDEFISMLEHDLGVESVPTVGEVARDLAGRHIGHLVTSREVTQIVTENGFGTEGAVHAFFSRTNEFERVGRGQYRLRSQDETEETVANDSPESNEQEHSPDAPETRPVRPLSGPSPATN